MSTKRSKAFFINGGAGRVICSIPALEKYAEESGDKDFIIVCEGGTEFYKGHPILDAKAYDSWQKNIFQDKLKHMDLVSPEPYRVWEYFNQKCSLAQAFDIEINNQGVRELSDPNIALSREETLSGLGVINEVKTGLKKDKVVVFQPFGRGISDHNGVLSDPSGRSIEHDSVINLIQKLQNDGWAVVMMSELRIDTKQTPLQEEIAQPDGATLRDWAAIISKADLFLGCDSVGQHISHSFDVPTIAVLGSTYPINVSYLETDRFKVVDLGEGNRQYSPIRIVQDESVDRANERLMYMTPEIEDYVIDEVKSLYKATKATTSKLLLK
jgi:ADP-heptose:LPS heptosyltransferase